MATSIAVILKQSARYEYFMVAIFGVIFGATITPIWGWVVAFLTVISLNFNGGGYNIRS